MFKIFCIFAALFVLVSEARPETYWIDSADNGALADTALSSCKGVTPLSGASACRYDKANGSGVAAGDTVYYRAGTYTINSSANAIAPYNTGTAFNAKITFTNYNSESVEFVGGGRAIALGDGNTTEPNAKSYIKVNGMTFTDFATHMWIYWGDYNEISYCTFIGYKSAATIEWVGSRLMRNAQYNHIHHNTFKNYGHYHNPWATSTAYSIGDKRVNGEEVYICLEGHTSGTFATDLAAGKWEIDDYPWGCGSDESAVFDIGHEDTTDQAYYNVIENNELAHGGHHVVGFNTKYNIIRNNYIHNEPWWPVGANPRLGNRNMIGVGMPDNAGRNLFEGNRIGYGGDTSEGDDTPCGSDIDQCGGSGINMDNPYNIFRQNMIYRTTFYGMYLASYSGRESGHDNKIYNNTFWHTGYWTDSIAVKNCRVNGARYSICTPDSATSNPNNVIKNNIFYQGYNGSTSTEDVAKLDGSVTANQIISNNWNGDTAGDPKFTSITGTPDPTNKTQFDFTLQSDSGAINGGTYLTQANGAGDNTVTLIVDEAGYFFYDWGTFSTYVPTATISADWIAIGTVDNVVQISSINYTTNTITLSSAKTWADDAPIWLYKNSQGTQVLYGSAPDYGAYEYTGVAAATATGLTITGGTIR